MSMTKLSKHFSLPKVPPKVEKQVRQWHSIEAESRREVISQTREKDMLQLRIAHKPLPALMETQLMSIPVVRMAAALLAPVAHAEYKAKGDLQTKLSKVQAQLEEHRATLTAATHHLDSLSRGSEEVAALVNGLRQGTLLKGDNTPPPRTGKMKVTFNERVEVREFSENPNE